MKFFKIYDYAFFILLNLPEISGNGTALNISIQKKEEITLLSTVRSCNSVNFVRSCLLTISSPDAVLIYTGHNEYYVDLGIGSTENIGGNPLLIRSILWLRDLRITQLITNGYDTITNLAATPVDSNRFPRFLPNYNAGVKH